jgi:hypothetical protein
MDRDGPATADQPLESDASRMNRRAAIRTAAVAGGALVWAGPAVQRVAAGPVFAASTPAPSPPPPPPDTSQAISYVGLVIRCEGQLWRGKWEAGRGWVDVTTVSGPNAALPHCANPSGWSEARGLPPADFNAPLGKPAIAIEQDPSGESPGAVCFSLPEGCEFVDGVAQGAGGDKTPQGFCEAGVSASASGTGERICFGPPRGKE